MVDKYYNSGKFSNTINYLTSFFYTPFDFYKKLAAYFYEKGYFRLSIGKNEYYSVLIDFFEENCSGENLKSFMEILKYDYLFFNKKRGLPDFIQKEISKEEETMIKEKYNLKAKEVYIEKFNIDIHRFIQEGIVYEESCFVVFYLSNTKNIIFVNK